MRLPRIRGRTAALNDEVGTRNAAFVLFCAFLVSYFLHLAARVSVLGIIHIDLLLAGATAFAIVVGQPSRRGRRQAGSPPWQQMDPVAVRLWILVGYIIVTLPFVEWPGSVLHNSERFVKSLCFFFFVVATVDTTRKLGILLAVYVFTQVYRVLEPLYMHVRFGYWGGLTTLGNWETMDRLSGSPWDIINANGLGNVVIVTLPMLHFLCRPDTLPRRIIWAAIAGAMCYALVLSASRSSFLAFLFLCGFVIWRSKHRAALLSVAIVGGMIALSLMTGLQKDRYLSIVSSTAPGAATAHERIQNVISDFKVSLRRPLFGHGLGTSAEANANFGNNYLLSHDLYTETAEELGYVGLALLLALIWSFIRACRIAMQVTAAAGTADERLRFLRDVARSLVLVVAVDLFFSFASYGLSEPYWYFYGGLTVVTARLAIKFAPDAARAKAIALSAGGTGRGLRGRRAGRAPSRGRVPAAGRMRRAADGS
ncbi:MAG TPA: O-antigen ligase family protein [Steroidobacteraceae bacterium]|nr:O-antigen ligase family protein [Steroidobacteraceae bacterium]